MNFIELTKNALINEQNKELQKKLASVLHVTLLKRLFVGETFDDIEDDNLSAKFVVGECCEFTAFAELETVDACNLLRWVENEMLEGGESK
jgi:hypothetical protein